MIKNILHSNHHLVTTIQQIHTKKKHYINCFGYNLKKQLNTHPKKNHNPSKRYQKK